MNDLIKKQDAIDAISNYTVSSPPYFSAWTDRLVSAIKDDLVDDIENIWHAQQWIPVSERLPEHKKARYWVCTDTGHQCECRWTDNRFGICNLSGEWGWSIFDTPPYSKVTAWMPLPEPYKEDDR